MPGLNENHLHAYLSAPSKTSDNELIEELIDINDVTRLASAQATFQEPDYGYLIDLVGHLVGLIHVQATNLSNQNLAHLNLTAKQAVTLHFIAKNCDLMQKDLAQGVGTSPTVMVGILDNLESQGYIRRVPSTIDRRSLTVSVTKDGKNVLTKVEKALRQTEHQLDEHSSLSLNERETLMKLLRKVANREVQS